MYEVWGLVVAGVMMTGFTANELSHGNVAEMMGLGHHHALDYNGYHCAGVEDATHWQHHVDHVHGGDASMPHAGCGGDHLRMHEAYGGRAR